MAERSILVRIRADVASLVSGMDRGRQAVERQRASVRELTNTLGLLGIGLVGVAGAAVKAFAQWDAKMAQVQSLTRASVGQMNQLRDATKGFATQFGVSASEAADAEIELVKAGVSVKDIINGGLSASLTLAAAGQLDVGRATEIAASAMTQFGLAGKDVSHIADLLAAGADRALGSVDDLGQGLKFIGPVAHSLGISIDQTVGSLALLAQNGILGEQAGTGLRGVLQALVSPSQQAQKVMNEYGITLFDAQGKFIGLAGMAGQLHDKLGDLTQAEQSAALGMIFGNHQVTAATVLMQAGTDVVNQWTSNVNDSGFAALQAAGKLNSLQGDVTKLGAALKNDLISTGSGANSTLRSLVQRATEVTEAFGKLPHGVQTALLAIVGGGGLVALGVAGLGKLILTAQSTALALQRIGLTSQRVGAVAGSIGKIAGAAAGMIAVAAAAGSLVTALTRGAVVQGANHLQLMVQNLAKSGDLASINEQFDHFGTFLGIARSNVSDLGEALKTVTAHDATSNLTNFFGGIPGLTTNIEIVQQRFQALDQTLAQMATDGHADQAAKAYSAIASAADAQGISMEKLATLFPAYADALAGAAADSTTAADAAAYLAQKQQEQEDAAKAASDAVDQWQQAVADAASTFIDLSGAFDDVIQKNKDLAQTAAEKSKSAKDSWQDFYDGTTVSARDYIRELQKQVDAQSRWESNMTDLSGRVNKTMSGDLQEAANNMIDELLQLGPKGAAEVQLLHDMSDRQLRKVVSLYEQKGTDAVNSFTQQIESSRPAKVPDPQISSQADAVSAFLARQQAILANNPLHVYVSQDTSSRLNYKPRATGGDITGGTPGVDSVPSLLMPGEHVLTASDVDKAGGQGAVYRMRAMIQTGMLRFGTGGAVSSARAAMDSAYSRWKSHRKAKNADDLRQAYEDARDKYDRLVDLQRDVTTSARRGDYVSNTTSGLSGAYGVVDDLLTASRNPDLSRGARRSLAAEAAKAEKALKSLYTQSDAIATRLDDAKNTLQDLSEIKTSVASSLTGNGTLADALAVTTNPSASGFVKFAQAKANKIKAFGGKLATLAKMGLTGTILQELAQLGTDQGTEVADALIAGGAAQIKQLNAAYSSIDQYANAAGVTVTQGFYKGGITAAQGLVDGLTKQQANIDKQIAQWGTALGQAMLKALGIKPTTAKKKAGGGWVTGPGGPTTDSVPLLASDGEFVMNAAAAYTNRALLERLNAGVPAMYALRSGQGGAAAGSSRSLNVHVTADSDQARQIAAATVTKVRDTVAAFGLGTVALT